MNKGTFIILAIVTLAVIEARNTTPAQAAIDAANATPQTPQEKAATAADQYGLTPDQQANLGNAYKYLIP